MGENERLAIMAQGGDADALTALVAGNIGLAAHIARRYRNIVEERRDLDLEDLSQAGCLGIYAAVMKYDPERDVQFTTYAVFHIRHEIRAALGIRSSKLDASRFANSLDEPLFGDSEPTTLGDTLIAPEPEDDPLERDELASAVRAALGRMKNDTNRRAIVEYYFEGKNTFKQAESEAVSHQAVTNRLFAGYRELYNDPTLRQWAVDYDYTNLYQHKGVKAFFSSRSSVVEDIVLKAEERENKRAALLEVLGSLA